MSTLLADIIASKRQQAQALEAEAAAIEALPADQRPAGSNAKCLAARESARQMREWAYFSERGAAA